MKALSVRNPWAWAILHAGKDIENRDWPTRFRGTVLLHASSWFRAEEMRLDFGDVRSIATAQGRTLPGPVTLRDLRDLGGRIVGMVDVVDCVEESESPWFFGRYGFVLRNPRPLARPILCKGALGFFEVPDDVASQVSP